MNKIKRGVSLYSYQEEFFLRKMTLEDCVAAVAATGATGIELLPEQMIKGFPNITDEFVNEWFRMMDKYGVEPIAYDAFLDTKLYANRILTTQESLDMMIRDLKIANRLGFKILRTLVSTPLEVVDKALPYAEKYNVKIALEVHSPFTFGTPWFEERMDYIRKTKTKWFGIMPDFGIFVKCMPKVIQNWHIRQGAHPEIIAYIAENYKNGVDKQKTIEEVEQMKEANVYDKQFAVTSSHFVFTDPNILKEYIPYIMHVHGKFYEVEENMEEPSIPYKDILQVLIENGFEGYIDSEYEGNRHIQDFMEVDSVEQVRRHQKMMENILGH